MNPFVPGRRVRRRVAQAVAVVIASRSVASGFAQATDVPAPSPGGSLTVLGFVVLLALAVALLAMVARQSALLRRSRDAEAARTAAEAEYRWLFETMAQGVVAHGADGTIVAANPAAERVLGLTVDQMRGVTSMDPRWQMVMEDGTPVSGADHPAMIALRTGEVVGPVTRGVRRPDRDEHVWLSITATPLFHPERRTPFQSYATFEDVTERFAAEAALRASEGRYRTLFGVNPQPMWVYDLSTLAFLEVNDAAVFHYGYTRSEFLALTLRDIRPVEDVPLLLEDVERPAPEMSVSGPWRHRTKGGEVIDVTISSHALSFDGRPARLVQVHNVTETLRVKEELVKLSLAVEQSPVSIVITDADGRIEYVNAGFVETSGYVREEVVGRNPSVLRSGKTPREVYERMWAALTAGQVWHGEFVNRRKDGSEYVESATIAPVSNSDGRVTHYVAVQQDVTESKRAAEELDAYRHRLEELVAARTEELIGARERAEAATRAKSAFLANMSHEIRTPINAVVGLTHLLRRDAPTPEQFERLRKIESATGHLLSIVSDILDLAKIEAGRLVIEERDFHLSAVLDHVHSMIAEAARAKGLTVEVDRDHVPVWLRGDPVRLRQALLNLAGNAVKFTNVGRVRLCARLLGESDDVLSVRFEVEDSGIGIPTERHPALFQAFEQLDPSVTREFGGTGLGLAITRRLAELMGGDVGVASEPGHGTRIWFNVRVRRGHGVTPTAEGTDVVDADALGILAGARVLLAEDNAINREVALELLHGFGVDVVAAENGRVAVEYARTEVFDVVLMDVQMPELDGLSATREIRTLPGYAGVPVLAMTANVFEDDRRACLAAGMDGFVAKPVDPPALRRMLTEWIQTGRSRRAEDGARDRMAPRDARPATAAGALEADASPTSELPQALRWPGLDADRTLVAVGGPERYLRLLRRFTADTVGEAEAIAAELAQDDVVAAAQRAHRLKGVAGTLGAVALYDAASLLEAVLRAGRTDDHLLDAVRHAFDELAQRVDRVGDGA